MVLVVLDFSDVSPIDVNVGNLDHLFGATFWHPMEVILPILLIVLFLTFGLVSFNSGKLEKATTTTMRPVSSQDKIKALLLLIGFGVLLFLIDLDDILKVLGISSPLRVSTQSPYYWLPMEAIFPIGSILLFFLFAKLCFALGKRS
jgi:hypothetical protein